MKKLSKVLSLVLVFAMVFSLCVIGASANNYEGYTDAKDVDANYVEAVDVLMGLGIVNGRSATTLAPKANYTRAEAAKIITYMQLGATQAESLGSTATMFKDTANHWGSKYIAYCAQQGIIGGFGDGTFGPDKTLTGYQWAKMLLCAVGYGVNKEYTGANWSINVAKDALNKGVFDNVLSASTNALVAREQAMQMAFNTLAYVNKVTYSSIVGDYIAGNYISGVSSNGTLGSNVYGLKPVDKVKVGVNGHVWIQGTSIKADKSNIVSNWYQDDVTIGTVTGPKTATAVKAEYTKSMFYKTVEYWYNGAQLANVTYATLADAVPAGSTAVLYDTPDADGYCDGLIDKVIVTEEYAASVSSVNKTAGTFTVVGAMGTFTLENTNAYTKGQVLLVVPQYTSNTSLVGTGFTNEFITEAVASVAFSGKITAVGAAGYVTVDGTKYNVSGNIYNSAVLAVGNTCDFYVDSTGAVCYAVLKESTAAANYCYVVESKGSQPNGFTGTAAFETAQIVTTEGKTVYAKLATYVGSDGATYVTVNGAPVQAGNGAVPAGYYTYTVSEDGTYNFAALGAKAVGLTYDQYVTVTNKSNTVNVNGTNKLASSATVLNVAGNGAVNTFTGYANWATATYTVGKSSSETAAPYAVVVYGDTTTSVVSTIYVFQPSAVATTTYAYCTGAVEVTSAGTSYGFYVNGNYVTYVVTSGTAAKGGIYTITVTGTTAAVAPATTLVADKEVTMADAGYFIAGGETYVYGTNCKIYDMTTADGTKVATVEPTALTATSTTANGDTVTVVHTSNTASVVYITAHN